tara:strand:- start:1497 stop:2735 length:1239 start_codon:yes stop_codon:yes gene_type:complete
MPQTTLKKIRKKQEACFGKDLQIMRNALFKPNTYKHFKTGVVLYQKIDLICKSSKFKKIVFEEFKEEIKEGLEILNLNESKILEIKNYWEITQLWTRLKPLRNDAKKWYELVLETEKYNLPPNSDKETVKKVREKAVKKALKIKLQEEQEKELEKQKQEEERKKEIAFKKELKFTKERQLKIAQEKVFLLEQKNKQLIEEKKLEKNNLKSLYRKVLKKINFPNTRDLLSRSSILCSCIFRDEFCEIKIKIDWSWEEKIEKSLLINAFSKVLDIPEDKLRIYYLGVQEKFEFTIDELTIEKLNSLEKWTMIEKNHSEVDLGNIYVLSNKSLPNTYKIGFTSKNPDLRAKSISSSLKETSEFIIEKSWITKNPFEVEQKIFYSLADYRQGNSEFFKCTLKRIFSTVERHLQKLD